MTNNDRSLKRAELKLTAPRALYFTLFAISGFSGLIYESIWSHYLKLFLGHAAYAQSLVLIIFMGGMAIGSWSASKFSTRLRIPILAYAAIEAIIGIVALLFHDLFVSLISTFHTSILPSLGSPALGITLKWLAASLLILPQSILLGMTFPLMSAGIIRRFPGTPGGSIAMLYFTNSIGAAIGVLASGFVMIRLFGLPGTIMTAGLLNIALALTVWVLVRLDPNPETEPLQTPPKTRSGDNLTRLFLVAAFITGAASFIYEISWIRMLSLVLGATTHSFELMLSAFITGLAFGGLWIKRRIDRIADPIRFSGFVQLIMGALALVTIPVYVMTFDWMVLLRGALTTNDAAFAGYSIGSHAIALAVMLPTTFVAGMTLPLFTYVLLDKGSGEASIGRIYASNTLGAIAGVLFAVHIGLPALGLKNLIVFGAALDIVLGLVLLLRYSSVGWTNVRFATTATIVFLVGGTIVVGVDFDQRLLTSGVYRSATIEGSKDSELLFYRDGKTASVSFRRTPDGFGVLATNGKTDASIQLEEGEQASHDEATMILAAILPMAYLPAAKTVANIGMGSGQTAHVVLGNPDIEVVDTIEIEVEMVNASRNFHDEVWRVYDDPRSRIHIEDAKTYFSLNNSSYDIIIAEPSNPWVSGVSSLFSEEFYATARDYLTDDGLFVQWIQAYEFTDELATSILKALSSNFGDYSVYMSNTSDIILVAKKKGQLNKPDWDQVLQGEVGNSLARVGIHTGSDLAIRQTANRAMLLPYLEDMPIHANSDYFPYVDLNAGKALFAQSNAGMFADWMSAPTPVLEMLTRPTLRFDEVSSGQYAHRAKIVDLASWLYKRISESEVAGPLSPELLVPSYFTYSVEWLAASRRTCPATTDRDRWQESTFGILTVALPNLDAANALQLVEDIEASACELADDGEIRAWLNTYRAVAGRDGRAMLRESKRLLDEFPPDIPERASYLFNVAVLGGVSTDQLSEAYRIWTEYGADVYKDLPLPSHVKLMISLSIRSEDEDRPQVASQ